MPTAPVAYEASSRNTYEARVRRALVALGSKDPDADIESTHEYLKHCKNLKLDPAVTAAGIYATVHHRHEPTSVLRGAGEAGRGSGLRGYQDGKKAAHELFIEHREEFERLWRHEGDGPLVDHATRLADVELKPSYYDRTEGWQSGFVDGIVAEAKKRWPLNRMPQGASEAGGYKRYDAITPTGSMRRVQFWAQKHGWETLGYPVPMDGGVWSVGVQFQDGSKSVVTVPNVDVERVWAAREAGASESPTGGEWEVTVRRQGTIEKLYQAAGRKPDEIIGQNVMFGEFYDDERAQAFAHKMMKAGYLSMFGPRRQVEAAESGAREAPRSRYRSGSDPQAERELETNRRATYNAKKSELISGLSPISGEDLFRKHKARPPENGRETVAVLSDAKTNEPVAILWKWDGWGYAESGGISTTYWLLPGVLPSGASEKRKLRGTSLAHAVDDMFVPRRKRSRAEDSAPCTRLERGGVTGECSALAKEIGPIDSDKDLYRLFAPRMRKETQEVFYVACVDVHGMLCGFTELARGQVSKVNVDVEDIVQCVLAVKPRPTAYAVAHCHPSGRATPSEADKKLTEDIRRAGKVAMPNTVFMDHLIVGGGNSNEYYSFTDGKLKNA